MIAIFEQPTSPEFGRRIDYCAEQTTFSFLLQGNPELAAARSHPLQRQHGCSPLLVGHWNQRCPPRRLRQTTALAASTSLS